MESNEIQCGVSIFDSEIAFKLVVSKNYFGSLSLPLVDRQKQVFRFPYGFKVLLDDLSKELCFFNCYCIHFRFNFAIVINKMKLLAPKEVLILFSFVKFYLQW